MHYVALVQQESLMSASKFYSFLMDDSPDAGHIEQESIVARKMT